MTIKIRQGNVLSDDIYIVSVPGTSIPVCSSFTKAEAVGELVLLQEFRLFATIPAALEIQDETGE